MEQMGNLELAKLCHHTNSSLMCGSHGFQPIICLN